MRSVRWQYNGGFWTEEGERLFRFVRRFAVACLRARLTAGRSCGLLLVVGCGACHRAEDLTEVIWQALSRLPSMRLYLLMESIAWVHAWLAACRVP